jgi:hypothetical protein
MNGKSIKDWKEQIMIHLKALPPLPTWTDRNHKKSVRTTQNPRELIPGVIP